MKTTNGFFRIAVSLALPVALICLQSCGSSTHAASTRLAVADYSNSRVLIYKAPLGVNESASTVLGKASFIQLAQLPCPPADANSLCLPSGIAKDSAGDFFVADAGDNRILRFPAPLANGMSADLVIGQPDFISNNAQSGASGMSFPTQVALDSTGNLWVADQQNSRVLEFVPPFNNGMIAALAIGQGSTGASLGCNQGGAAPTAATLCNPTGISFDAQGNLWISDSSNNRLLEFNAPFSTGMAASLELGQPAAAAFTSSAANNGGVSASTLCGGAAGPAFDSGGNLWVADNCNHRVLGFAPPFSNGEAASTVIGQPDFAHNSQNQGFGGTPESNTLSFPSAAAIDEHGDLIVSDSRNNRVLVFAPPFTNGMSAVTLLGQFNFSLGMPNQKNTAFPQANTLSHPAGVLPF